MADQLSAIAFLSHFKGVASGFFLSMIPDAFCFLKMGIFSIEITSVLKFRCFCLKIYRFAVHNRFDSVRKGSKKHQPAPLV